MAGNKLDIQEMARTPIPEVQSVDGWQDVPIVENGEPLVSFRELGIPYSPFYKGEDGFSPYTGSNKLAGALHHVWVRESVGEKLLLAQALLPGDTSIIGLDGQRPKIVQNSLRTFFDGQLESLRPDWSQPQRDAFANKYVSKSTNDAPHRTGANIDSWLMTLPEGTTRRSLGKAIVDKTVLMSSVWMPSGVPFDHGGEKAGLRYYETHDDSPGDKAARENRRVKFWIMTQAGLWPYPDEFWEFALGTQKARQAAGSREPACYGGVDLSPAQQNLENRLTARPDRRHIATPGFPMGEIIEPVF